MMKKKSLKTSEELGQIKDILKGNFNRLNSILSGLSKN